MVPVVPQHGWKRRTADRAGALDAQRHGVDYSKLKYQGATAFDYAKQLGQQDLLRVLQPKELAL